jgi:hypothetical protein
MKITGLSNWVIAKNLRINMPYHDCACNAVDTLDAGPSYRRQFYCVSSPVEENQEFVPLYISYLKSTVHRLSVAALLKHKFAVSGHKNRRSFQVSYRKEIETYKRDADLSLD